MIAPERGCVSRFGEAGVKGAGAGGGPGFSDFGDFSPFGDIFETFFGGGGGGGGGRRRQQGPQQGDDLRLDLEIDFMTAIFGGEEKIRISHLETCDTCTVSMDTLLLSSTVVLMYAGEANLIHESATHDDTRD
jgi:molecular chaperone DnaJ